MRRLRHPQRKKRLHEAMNAAWKAARAFQSDPGLKEAYETLPRAPIKIVACRMNKAANHGGLIRLAEAYRLESLMFEAEEDDTFDMSGVRGAQQWLDWQFGDVYTEVDKQKAAGRKIYGLTLCDRAVPVQEIDWLFPATLILGRELQGLPSIMEQKCDECIAIPMYGLTTSLNVYSAAAITIDRMVEAYRRAHPQFEPARNASRKLLQIPEADYSEFLLSDSDSEDSND
ncbi:MAG: hypothetical protein KDC26_09175 [Armatimonadetes bacterium]|nr:hypothetical protein [Armatimonadota bacterium]